MIFWHGIVVVINYAVFKVIQRENMFGILPLFLYSYSPCRSTYSLIVCYCFVFASKFQILFPYVYSIMRMNDAKQVIYEYN